MNPHFVQKILCININNRVKALNRIILFLHRSIGVNTTFWRKIEIEIQIQMQPIYQVSPDAAESTVKFSFLREQSL